MSDTVLAGRNRSFATLRRLVAERNSAERCDLCGAALQPDHAHLADPQARKLACACPACALLFSNRRGGKYRRVPDVVHYLSDFRQTDVQWDSLGIPIGLAFFFHSTAAAKVVALYPSPAGPMESLLDFGSWDEMTQSNPCLKNMEADVEGLLVNRIGSTREYYLVPIDVCFRLTGLIRSRWRGLSGGAQLWREIDGFFAELKRRSLAHREGFRA
jgi:hypothetical protein